MPKSNFSQFLDECENFRTVQNKTISKISFESNSCYSECENQNKHVTDNTLSSENDIKASNTNSFSSSKFSSNIFLSKSTNNQNVFSTNRPSNNVAHRECIKKETNMFKKVEMNNTAAGKRSSYTSSVLPSPSLSPSPSPSLPLVEINNETFPSLASGCTTAAIRTSDNNTVPKKFKNFKDAICASVVQPVVPSLTKQKQLKATAVINSYKSSVTHPPPLVVKKDSEIYAKKILAKSNSYAYDDEDDDDDLQIENNKSSEYLYRNVCKKPFIKKQHNDEDYSDNDD
jgi:hypothetical protein